jgi:hypothetical protein
MKVLIEIGYEDDLHCCDIAVNRNPREKCKFLTAITYCSLFQEVLKRDPDLFTTIKCDQCKEAHKNAKS